MHEIQHVAEDEFLARCLKRLRALDLPLTGWYCSDVEDTEQINNQCDLCGCTRVRFIHHMRHPLVSAEFQVGCLCDGIMSEDDLGALQREREAKNRIMRRQKFVHGKWRVESCTHRGICWAKKMRKGPLCRIRKDYDNRFAVWHNEHWCYLCKGEPIGNFIEAAYALFAVNDSKREST